VGFYIPQKMHVIIFYSFWFLCPPPKVSGSGRRGPSKNDQLKESAFAADTSDLSRKRIFHKDIKKYQAIQFGFMAMYPAAAKRPA